MRPQADQRLCRVDVERCDDHAGGLVDLDAVQRAQLSPAVLLAATDGRTVCGEHVQQRQRRELGGQQPAGQCLAAERPWTSAVHVQGSDPLGGQGHRQREHRRDPGLQDRLGERRPARLRRVVQVSHQHRAALADGIQAGALPEGELQGVQPPAQVPTGPERPSVRPVQGQGDRRPVDVQEPDARLAQPVGNRQRGAGARHDRPQLGTQLLVADHARCPPAADGSSSRAGRSEPRPGHCAEKTCPVYPRVAMSTA